MTTTPIRGKAASAGPAEQPFSYPLRREFVEPDWRRLPGYKAVTQAEWESSVWQRKNTVKNLKELGFFSLREAAERAARDAAADRGRATGS